MDDSAAIAPSMAGLQGKLSKCFRVYARLPLSGEAPGWIGFRDRGFLRYASRAATSLRRRNSFEVPALVDTRNDLQWRNITGGGWRALALDWIFQGRRRVQTRGPSLEEPGGPHAIYPFGLR